ncbi:hypothetical protein F0248_07400 [Vibrio crassostreae]|uniref:hypothetical protein n=1 Tax=Vibrio crassostreae TaxID=246167 RepID=UPI000F498AD7|nr:hypothetical protein [Vibrio crassostreae]NOH75328.1 hypothetical protein [Vibrio crassostreae]NOI52912.1 hypothetical protein [Vibrio crassostreae]ROR09681.1 hypothetical protein EDB36_11356 [Vibrio crassostreae]CAK1795078.1 conserved hypothetical protein [Vibrio crassostreae]CAK2279155.1 conserved hypothetical protein [Vibrio crassostreae]
MDDTSLKKLTTEEKVTILEEEISRVEGRTGEFLKLFVSHYPQALTRTEIKELLVVNNNPSFVSLYRNGNIFIDIEKRYCDAAQENRYHIGTQYLQDVQCSRRVNAL